MLRKGFHVIRRKCSSYTFIDYRVMFPQNIDTILNSDTSVVRRRYENADFVQKYYEDAYCKNATIIVGSVNALIWKLMHDKSRTHFTTEFTLSSYLEHHRKLIFSNCTDIDAIHCFPDMYLIMDYFREYGFNCAYERHCNMQNSVKEKHIVMREFKLDVNYNKQRNPKWQLDMVEHKYLLGQAISA